MPSPRIQNRRSLLALASLTVLGWATACGDAPPAPVVIPADFSTEPDVSALLSARYRSAAEAPGNAERHRTLGLALVANDGADLAETSFAHAIALDPDDAESHYQIARIRGERGDLDGQIETLRKTLEVDPAFHAATYALGCALLDRGDLDEANQAFRTVQAKLGPTFMGELGLGLVALERDRPDEAIPFLEKAAARYPGDLFIRFQLGQAHLALGQDEVANDLMSGIDDALGRPILRSPAARQIDEFAVNRLTQISRAVELMRSGDNRRAQAILKRFFGQDESDTAAGNNLAVTHIRLGELDDAMAVIERLKELDADNHAVWVTAADALLNVAEKVRVAGDVDASRDELTRALASIEKAIELSPRSGEARRTQGQILRALKRDGDALAAFREALSLGETQESTYLDMSPTVRKVEGDESLEALLREGIAQPGTRAQLRFELCGVLVRSGRGEEARAAQRELERVAPESELARSADAMLRSQGY